ncbi:leucine-rich repeat-containing protein 74B-like isoform X2 [Mizuhopecten yessoensis]|uniref:leucine-rich repeat-containing protein 74B-like isoform X2 n=1 Tax=Mizuhopecten yessoensis TaxID=6573 RepID=UPI000B45A9EF|nr:leucine-rich repeat-containing protein 74B-like isoform X2 [Mizuhopecten yessoensis]
MDATLGTGIGHIYRTTGSASIAQLLLFSVPEESDVEMEIDHGLGSRTDTRLSIGRVPSQMSRATMVRTPAARPTTQEKVIQEMDDQENILITELKQSEYRLEESEEVESPREPDILYLDDKVPITSRTEEDEYDTDLEVEEDSEDLHDTSGKSNYKKICSQFGVVPISYFVRHILDQELVMRYHGLGPVAAKAMALVLKDNVTLEKLNLNGNWIEGPGGEAMARMLEENDYISEVCLSDNRLGTTGAKSLCRMLGVNTGLRKIDLSDNAFEDGAVEFFVEMLDNNKYLKSLNLSRNRFGEQAGELLGPAIASNDILDSLDLSWNHLRQKGAVSVARGLKENVRLKYCSLAWNGFGPEGGAAIADALVTNNSLQEIDISGNRLNADVAVKVAKAIAVNDNIRVLRMGNNLLTTIGAIALARSINETDSSEMEELDLTDIPVEFEFLRICEDIKMKRTNFKVTHGPILRSGNTMEDLGKPAIDPFKRKDPVMVLQDHIVVNDMRLLDILKRHDPNETLEVTPEQFMAALDELAVPYDKPKVDEAIERIAKEQNGRIHFGDFIKQFEQTGEDVNAADEDDQVT